MIHSDGKPWRYPQGWQDLLGFGQGTSSAYQATMSPNRATSTRRCGGRGLACVLATVALVMTMEPHQIKEPDPKPGPTNPAPSPSPRPTPGEPGPTVPPSPPVPPQSSG